MAEAKRKPGRPPGSKNKNTASGTKSSGGSGGRGNKNGESKAKARVQEIQAERKADKRVMDEIWAIIAIAIGVFLIVATFTEGAGQFGEMIGNGLKGILGFIAYIFPFYIILYGVLLFAKKTVHISLKSGALIFIILLMMTIMNSVRFIDVKAIELTWQAMKAFYTTGVHLTSGGFIGMISASFLIKWLGVVGCWIFAVVVTSIALLLLINTPVSRLITKIGDKMEERRLLKEHAHLDYMSEDEQGIQVAMEELAPKKLPSKRQKKVLNSSVLEDKEDISSQNPSARPVSADAGITDDAGAGIVSQPEIIISGNIQEDESPTEAPEIPKREYIPPSQVEPLNQEKKNSILKYMSDDSLFGRKPSNSMGLESKTDAAAGFGLDGLPTGSGSSGTTGLTGIEPQEEISPVSGSNRFINRNGQKIDPGAPASAASAASASSVSAECGGTPAAELQPKLTNKEAREAMLTTEELDQAAKPVKVYHKPPLDLLTRSAGGAKTNSKLLQAKAMKLEETLKNFHVDARVVQVTQGPTVTRYEIQPAVGVKVSSIVRLADDIALNLEARSIRIEAPIPGKAAVGIEVENDAVSMVKLRDIIDSKPFQSAKSKITFAVGKDISGNAIVADLKSMPHLLIAGSTGSGKSVCINSIILSLLYKATPDEVKLILVDPKVVELGNYNGIPHLLIPVVTDPSKAAAALNWAVAEMTDRYKKFAEAGVRDLESYNESARADGEEDKVMPQVVIIIDELADLMMAAPSQIEESICRLAQMARAAGMHLIVATQRPSVDVITGVIKANIPSRIAFAVSSQVDSRTILDMQGAEKLVGKGDMLFNPMGMGKPIRVQGTFVSDSEVHDVIQFVKSQVEDSASSYNEEILTRIERTGSSSQAEETDDLLPEAIDLVVRSGQASVSMLQRRFRIGYNRAARIVDMMEARGIIGPQDGSRPRQVLMTEEELEQMEGEI
ncbi:MAG: DNA translocase FtsK 4TM domain-containing protein [Anaerovoracaceae bacterium]